MVTWKRGGSRPGVTVSKGKGRLKALKWECVHVCRPHGGGCGMRLGVGTGGAAGVGM